jgi:hypothetical protein
MYVRAILRDKRNSYFTLCALPLGYKNHTNSDFDVKVISIMLEHHFVGFLSLSLVYLRMSMCTYYGKHIAPEKSH